MAENSRNPLVDYAVYLAVRLAICVLQAIPLRVALGFANVLALLVYRVDRRHREVARDNLRHAFPEQGCGETGVVSEAALKLTPYRVFFLALGSEIVNVEAAALEYGAAGHGFAVNRNLERGDASGALPDDFSELANPSTAAEHVPLHAQNHYIRRPAKPGGGANDRLEDRLEMRR